jgi:membrane fusion protein (multidrug efflux system)
MKRLLIGGIGGGLALVAIVALIATRDARTGRAATAADRADSNQAAVLDTSDIARATVGDLLAGVPVSGTLKPVVDIRIASPIPEVVDEVLVREGQAVHQGQVLARLRASALEPAATSADAQRRKAASDFARMQNMFREGAVSQSDVETAEVALRAAEAADSRARKQLDEATVRASVSGVVSERHVDAGDRVKDGDQLFRLVNTSELEFEATVPSEFAGRVHPGAPVALSVTGTPDSGASLGGRVARVNPTVDAATRQVKVYVAVPNHGGRFVGGQFASGRIVLSRVTRAVAVPQAAVRRDSSGTSYVLVIERGRIARAEVTIGATDEQAMLVEIARGLLGGETVIVGPANGLRAGQAVSVARTKS